MEDQESGSSLKATELKHDVPDGEPIRHVHPLTEDQVVAEISDYDHQNPEMFDKERNVVESRNETENELNWALDKKEFKDIEERVNPKVLMSCKTNALIKAFEVNKKLKNLELEGGPDEEKFKKLANIVEEFSVAFIDPLDSDDIVETARTGEGWWEYVLNEAMRLEQRKFISHPVVDNSLQERWLQSFFSMRNSSWGKPDRWKFVFLHLCALIDVLTFPLLFALVCIICTIPRCKGWNVHYLFDTYTEYFMTPYFIFVRDTLNYFCLLGLHCVICLLPSTVAFSALEWVIFAFFLARLVMEVDQFIGAEKAERKRMQNMFECGMRQSELHTEENTLIRKISHYFRDQWNILDFIILITYLNTFSLRMTTWQRSISVSHDRLLAISFNLYGLIAMFLTLRAFGHVMEGVRGIGAIQIALFYIIRDVVAIFWQFLAAIVAFSLAITKVYISERSFLSTEEGSKEMACNTAGVSCWWSIARHLVWSLLGIAELDPLESLDGTSVVLVYVLYGLFLIMGVILLVNMMVALLSNTYQRVQENSLREWSFKKALTIQTYSLYHPVPVPFNLVSLPGMALYRFCKRRERESSPDFNAANEKHSLYCVMELELKPKYFATYGYSFPLTDEGKIDQLLHETCGNRSMANAIMKRVIRDEDGSETKFGIGKHVWKTTGIEIEGSLLTHKGADFCDDCKTLLDSGQCHGARYIKPFSREMPRMEVLIQEGGETRFVGVGAVFEGYPRHNMPGWSNGSVGYHSDDGKIFEDDGLPLGRDANDAMAYRGDLMACEVDFDEIKQHGAIPVKFFLNGSMVGQATMKQFAADKDALPYPYIGMQSKGTRVLVKMCGKSRDASIDTAYGNMMHMLGLIQEKITAIQEQNREEREEIRNMLEDIKKKL